MARDDEMRDIAQRIEDMIHLYGRRSDIAITYDRPTDESISSFSEWERKRFSLRTGEEYFFVWETPCPADVDPRALLYVVNVTADSLLTAAHMLMSLVAIKF
ncbi:MAG: hypothetical protein IJP78_08000 [Clostridia bacterium]|nr:hypothetical protein [Clostridia bacterium]